MSVLAGIETEAPGRAALGQSDAHAGAQRKAQTWFGAPQGNVSSASQSGAQSFRSSWQTQLASLVSGKETLGLAAIATKGSPGGTDIVSSSDQSSPEAAPENSSEANSPSVSGSALPWRLADRQDAAQKGASKASTIPQVPPTSRLQDPGARRTAGIDRRPDTTEETKRLAEAERSESTPALPACAGRQNRQDSLADARVPEPVVSSAANASQTLPAPIAVPAPSLPVVKSVPALSSLRAASPGFTGQNTSAENSPAAWHSVSSTRNQEEVGSRPALTPGNTTLQQNPPPASAGDLSAAEGKVLGPAGALSSFAAESPANRPSGAPALPNAGAQAPQAAAQPGFVPRPNQTEAPVASPAAENIGVSVSGSQTDQGTKRDIVNSSPRHGIAPEDRMSDPAAVGSGNRTSPAFSSPESGAGPQMPILVHARPALQTAAGTSSHADVAGSDATSAQQRDSSPVAKQLSLPDPNHLQPQELQTAPVQGQIRIQARSESQPGERIPIPASGNPVEKRAEADKAAGSLAQTALPATGNPELVAAARRSSPVAPRTARGAVAVGTVARGVPTPQAPSSGPIGDMFAPVRDPIGLHGTTNGVRGDPKDSASAARPPANETFAAIDAGIRPGTQNWIHVGTQRAEAGFQDPALGWVGVRADASGGQVHATLVPGSADAAQALGGHMSGLNAYLAEMHTPVETLTLAMPEGREATSGAGRDQTFDMSQGMSQGMNQGMNQNAGQGSSSEPHPNPEPAMPAVSAAIPLETRPSITNIHPAPGMQEQSGTRISVMA
jgi:hypothetical protein